ncbi:1-acyl-sn-glycerol-3-phosphate acyltransferase, partial [Azonexus sp.]|uniref:1-acyl-sn-glycerol-3-phosphate acyltransferase n=1 Tax=Azonexus sp. TaxID=1872668 RepID=UPI002829DB74
MFALFRLLLRGLMRFLFRVRVRGLEQALAAGVHGESQRLLVVANHESFLDGILLGLFLPISNPVFVIHTEIIRRTLWRWVIGAVADYLTVDPGNPMAMKQ